MTDREQDQAHAREEREETLLERSEDVVRRPVGEEVDPDSIRHAPSLDEEGEVVDEEDLEELRRGQ